MFPYWVKQRFPKKSRPAPRRRPARVHLGLEPLEVREVPTVFSGISGGTLVVHTNNFDGVAIDHVVNSGGSFTEVTSVSGTFLFRDSAITNGIHLQGGFHDVQILATVKPLTYETPRARCPGGVAIRDRRTAVVRFPRTDQAPGPRGGDGSSLGGYVP
jgi:hypothetical protein